MKRFYIRAVASTNKGTLILQDRNLKKVRKQLKRNNLKYKLMYVKLIRKGRVNSWYKYTIAEDKLYADYIKAGVLK